MPTKIEWTDETWNPIRARNLETGRAGHFCVHVSPACEHCYAEGMQARLFGNPVRYAAQDAEKVEIFLHENALMQPLRWRKPRRIFVCSMTDLFYEGHSDDLIDKVFAAMALAPQHTFQVLTKRAARMREYLTRPVQGPWAGRAYTMDADGGTIRDMTQARFRLIQTVPDLLLQCPPGALNRASEWQDTHYPGGGGFVRAWPLPNVWLGVSAEDQRRAEERIPVLLDTPAAVRFLSAEPLLGPIDLQPYLERCHASRDGDCIAPSCPQVRDDEPAATGRHCPLDDWNDAPEGHAPARLDQVIVGGESGPGARPMHPQWARDLRDQCQLTGVPYFFKQWGQWAPIDHSDAADEAGWQGRGDWMILDRAGGVDIPDHRWPDEEAGEVAIIRVGKKRAGRLLDAREWNEVPA